MQPKFATQIWGAEFMFRAPFRKPELCSQGLHLTTYLLTNEVTHGRESV